MANKALNFLVRCRVVFLICAAFVIGGCEGPIREGIRPTRVTIAFYDDQWSQPGVGRKLAAEIAARRAFLVGHTGGADGVVRWTSPNSSAPAPLTPRLTRREAPGVGYSLEYGPLHLTVIETKDPLRAGGDAYRRLLEDLSLTEKPCKVILMSQPIFSAGPVPVDRERLDLADLLARERALLAISTESSPAVPPTGPAGKGVAGPLYFRSARIGPSMQESVQYVVMGSDRPAEEQKPAFAWVARTIVQPYFCVLDARLRELHWAAYDQDGRMVDEIVLTPAQRVAGASRLFSVSEVLASLTGQEPGDTSESAVEK